MSFGNRCFDEAQRRVIEADLEAPIPMERLATRSGGAAGSMVYLSGNVAIDLANYYFGFNGWSTKIDSLKLDFEDFTNHKWNIGAEAIVTVTLADGSFRQDVGCGDCSQKNRAKALEAAKKEAVTDAIKRALRQIGNGLGNCIYDAKYVKEAKRGRSKDYKPAVQPRSHLYQQIELKEQQARPLQPKQAQNHTKSANQQQQGHTYAVSAMQTFDTVQENGSWSAAAQSIVAVQLPNGSSRQDCGSGVAKNQPSALAAQTLAKQHCVEDGIKRAQRQIPPKIIANATISRSGHDNDSRVLSPVEPVQHRRTAQQNQRQQSMQASPQQGRPNSSPSPQQTRQQHQIHPHIQQQPQHQQQQQKQILPRHQPQNQPSTHTVDTLAKQHCVEDGINREQRQIPAGANANAAVSRHPQHPNQNQNQPQNLQPAKQNRLLNHNHPQNQNQNGSHNKNQLQNPNQQQNGKPLQIRNQNLHRIPNQNQNQNRSPSLNQHPVQNQNQKRPLHQNPQQQQQQQQNNGPQIQNQHQKQSQQNLHRTPNHNASYPMHIRSHNQDQPRPNDPPNKNQKHPSYPNPNPHHQQQPNQHRGPPASLAHSKALSSASAIGPRPAGSYDNLGPIRLPGPHLQQQKPAPNSASSARPPAHQIRPPGKENVNTRPVVFPLIISDDSQTGGQADQRPNPPQHGGHRKMPQQFSPNTAVLENNGKGYGHERDLKRARTSHHP